MYKEIYKPNVPRFDKLFKKKVVKLLDDEKSVNRVDSILVYLLNYGCNIRWKSEINTLL